MIDCREFRPAPNPFPPGTGAWHLHGSAREQWYWWYQAKRLERRGAPLKLVSGHLGVLLGLQFVE